uniref:Uncharacterized protein n=2 Tax=Cacopsylla melanoneura TaxID=428564 RepID=A0A8D8WEN9_9HEMI
MHSFSFLMTFHLHFITLFFFCSFSYIRYMFPACYMYHVRHVVYHVLLVFFLSISPLFSTISFPNVLSSLFILLNSFLILPSSSSVENISSLTNTHGVFSFPACSSLSLFIPSFTLSLHLCLFNTGCYKMSASS